MQKQAKHQLYPTASCLIRVLRDELATLSSNDLQDIDVILPTQRLSLMLQAALANSRKAFVPGQWLTLQEFLKQQLLLHEVVLPTTADELNVELTLFTLLKRGSENGDFKILRVGQEKAIYQFFRELGQQRRGVELIRDMHTILSRDIFRSDAKVTSQHQKLDELQLLWQKTISWYADRDQIPEFIADAECIQKVLQLWGPHYEHPRCLKLVGLTSVADIYLPVLEKLSENSDVYLHALPEGIDSKDSPLTPIIHSIKGLKETEIIRSHESTSCGVIYAANSIFDEIEKALEQVQNLIKSGLSPSQIAILIPDEATYEPILREWNANQCEFNTNLALSHQLKQTERGRWLVSLAECILKPLDALIIAGFAQHTITARHLAKQTGLSFDHVNARLTTLFCSEHNHGDLIKLITMTRDPDSKALLEILQKTLQSHLAHNPKLLKEHLEDLLQTCLFYDFEDAQFLEDDGLASAFEQFFTDFKQTIQLTSESHELVSKEVFWRLLQSGLAKSIRSTGEPLKGVQILTLSEARHVPFQALVILGCIEGQFPRYMTSDGLVDDFLKQQVGLPSWRTFDAMEELTFALFDSQIPSVDLMYVAGKESLTQPSRFIERLLRRGSHRQWLPVEANIDQKSYPTPLKSRPHLAAQETPRLLDHISASRLEDLVSCPFKFLYRQLKVRHLDLPSKHESIEVGQALHKILELFFAGSRQYQIPPLSSLPAFDKSSILQRLNELTSKIFRDMNIHKDLQLRLHSWEKFAEFMTKLLSDKTFQDHPEWNLDRHDLFFEWNDLSIRLGGKIDQVLDLDEAFVLLDYKTNSSPKGSDLKKGYALQPIYYLWALAKLDAARYASQKAIVGYWEILPGRWQGRSVGPDSASFAKEQSLVGRPLQNHELIETMLELWQWRLTEILTSNEFIADASECSYCHFKSICRRHDARYQKFFESSKQLKQRVGSSEVEDAE